ncbi:MAG: rSAM/selenodomain-associated transferase 2 [Bacteroidia bacterium]|jgi:rSAM/selenodomain-associated transferase 2
MPSEKKISIIIPTLNEEYFITKLIPHLRNGDKQNLVKEIILVDAGSKDETCKIGEELGVRIIHSTQKGRAIQMNLGAKHAKSEILHFIHADAFPPENFSQEVLNILESCDAGCFRSLFDTDGWFLRTNSWFTRFNGTFFRGGGQTLFMERDLFRELGGYDESVDLMEEYELIQRIKKNGSFKVIQQDVLVSARDYNKHGHWTLQTKYSLIYALFFFGFSQKTMKKFYSWLMKKH